MPVFFFIILIIEMKLFYMEYLQVKLKQGLKAAMAISSEGNIYLQVRIVIDSIGSYFVLRNIFF